MLRFENFSFKYSLGDKFALKDINLKIEDGEFVLVVGDSGSGKTTFLRSINGLIPHFYGGMYSGYVEVCGIKVRDTPPRELAKYVGTIFQDPENQVLMGDVERDIAFAIENMGLPPDEITKRVEEALDLVNIAGLRHRKIDTLSGGEKQKVAIASAIAMHPQVLLLDEPTSQIDPKSGEEILSLLERVNDELGLTIILVEHRLERTMHRADRLIVFHRGRIIGDGEPRIVVSRTDMDSVGVGYPPVTRIAKLKGIGSIPLTVKEGRKTLRDVFLKARLMDAVRNKRNVLMQLRSVYFSYGDRQVIRNLNLSVYEGEILGIIGRNGSGKTTLAKIIAKILKPDRGKILFRGKNYYNMKNSLVGLVFQNPNVHIMGDSVYDDLAYTLKARGERNVKDRVERIMKELGIESLRDRNPMDLSGGERMLVAIGTVAVAKPSLLILDEPTRGLSFSQKMKLSRFIKNYARRRSVILISHDMESVARTCERVAMISEGKIIMEGDRRDILSSSLTFSPQLNKVAQGFKSLGVNQKILIEEDLGDFP